MRMKIIGRERERKIIEDCYSSKRPEFLAIYGRRRVGKTFLIRQTLKNKITFAVSGVYKGTRITQLTAFAKELSHTTGKQVPVPKNWWDAFDLLRTYLEKLPKGRKVVFLDEMPWMDTQKSGFIQALEWFWNGWGSTVEDLMVIVCGSATSWMRDKLIRSKGGLHNRLTRRIYLKPFSLCETEKYIKNRGVNFNRYEIVECYMIFGGIPYYLDMLQPEFSLLQNVDSIMVGPEAPLSDEYDMLYGALFEHSEKYTEVVETLYQKKEGMTRMELLQALDKKEGGRYTKILHDLETSGIITSYNSFGKQKQGLVYRLTDFFTLFYLRFLKGKKITDMQYWEHLADSPVRRNWCGHAFELVALMHTQQIKKKLSILGVLAEESVWRSSTANKNMQVDLVIDRRDEVINLCEMKYSLKEFSIDKDYENKLRERQELFREETKTRKALHITFVTTYGLVKNKYSSIVQSEVTLDDLFEE